MAKCFWEIDLLHKHNKLGLIHAGVWNYIIGYFKQKTSGSKSNWAMQLYIMSALESDNNSMQKGCIKLLRTILSFYRRVNYGPWGSENSVNDTQANTNSTNRVWIQWYFSHILVFIWYCDTYNLMFIRHVQTLKPRLDSNKFFLWP